MASPLLLDAALNNATVPHQPYVLISDEPTFGGVPIMREMIRRSIARQSPVLLICVLRPSTTYLPPSSGINFGSDLEVVDLTDQIPGYSDTDLESVKSRILKAAERLGPKVEIYIDAIDVFADDYTSLGAISLIRGLLKQIKSNKAPSRLTLLLSSTSSLYPSLLPPSFSPSLTQIHPHPLSLLTALSTAYLAPISSEPKFLDLLNMAADRRIGERMAWLGEGGVGDWSTGPSKNGSSSKGKGRGEDDGQGVAGIQVIVRKSTGGAKGMSRSLEGSVSSSSSGLAGGLSVRSLGDIMDLTPFSHPVTQISKNGDSRQQPSTGQSAPPPAATHTALNLPFNLSLTDDQRRRRDTVPIPYVHEGEGVEVGWEEEEDDDDDEEI